MKKTLFILSLAFIGIVCAWAQVTTVPAIIQKGYTGPVTIIFNPNQGNKGMVGASACYAHTGYNNWLGAPEWRSGLDKHKMTKNTDGNWELSMPNGLYAYYGITSQTNVTRLCFVFNDGKNGNKEGKDANGGDIFVTLAESGLQVQMTSAMAELSIVGQQVTLNCNATETADLTLKSNGETVKTGTGKEIIYTATLSTTGTNTFEFTASADGVTKTTQLETYVCNLSQEEARPTGLKMGITYDNSPSVATLCTFAAGCKTPNDLSVLEHAKTIYVVGSFNQWKINDNYQMKRDGNYFWLKLTGLTPGLEYTYQYLVLRADGKVVRISDLYSTRLKEGVSGANGYATILQTQAQTYKWSDATLHFKRPNKNNLIIYELWVYDHTANKNLKGLLNQLDYFKQLGINCIELMPVNEFDGNQSWGYSPNHYFAIDKQYGQPNDLKTFVDSCHKHGIAVVLDMVLNHSTGNNPMNKLYPYGEDLQYNPWFNVKAPHPDNVYEDWNHDFEPTHQMMIDVLKFWMEEYKVDGYRLDLSHGLCGKSYNAVTNLTDYYTKAVQPLGGYMMLEHWGNSMGSDRPKLVNAGMMCWENTCNAFEQVTMGWLKDGDALNNANKDNYISYCETHDEERCFFKAKKWGNGSLQTDEAARIKRIPLVLGFQAMLNGPQLFYHFAEIGSELGKFQSKTGAIGKEDGENPPCAYGATSCQNYNYKMDPKEVYKMTWTEETTARTQAMLQVGKIIKLRTKYLPSVFEGNPTAAKLGSGVEVRSVQWGNDVLVVGNFSASAGNSYTIPAGTWYDYLNNNQKITTSNLSLSPGDLRILVGSPVVTDIDEVNMDITPAAKPTKFIQDGRFLILRDGVLFDALGRPL
ncbi:MAG: alpha-amylase family glycosyl hydrolase [Paludibacteraceae bacterium]|nr:alpha-amylase family glycosyl hydrolase [Paludibacteraceae bacterium]